MTDPKPSAVDGGLYVEIQRFLFREAALLDRRDYGAWLALDDRGHPVPCDAPRCRVTLAPTPVDYAIVDENLVGLKSRIDQISNPRLTRAENPPSHDAPRRFKYRGVPRPKTLRVSASCDILSARLPEPPQRLRRAASMSRKGTTCCARLERIGGWRAALRPARSLHALRRLPQHVALIYGSHRRHVRLHEHRHHCQRRTAATSPRDRRAWPCRRIHDPRRDDASAHPLLPRDGSAAAARVRLSLAISARRCIRIFTISVAIPQSRRSTSRRRIGFTRVQAIEAMEHGKHVLVEKPLALTLEDCDAVVAAADRTGLHLIVGHTHAFDPNIREMHRIIQERRVWQARHDPCLQLQRLPLASASR